MSTPATPSDIDDHAIWDMVVSPMHLIAVSAALDLGILETLEATRVAAPDIATRVGVSTSACAVLLEHLRALGLVNVTDRGYELSQIARRYLLTSSPYYFGPVLNEWSRCFQPEVRSFASRLRSHPDAAEVYREEEAQRLARLFDSYTREVAEVVASQVDLSNAQCVMDVGGGQGTVTAALLGRFPQLSGVIVDLPQVKQIAAALLAERGVAERVRFVGQDLSLGFPELEVRPDVVVVSQLLVDLEPSDRRRLMQGCVEMASGRGQLICLDIVKPDAAYGPTLAAFDTEMLLWSQDGGHLTADGLITLLSSTGWADVRLRHVTGYWWMATAHKASG